LKTNAAFGDSACADINRVTPPDKISAPENELPPAKSKMPFPERSNVPSPVSAPDKTTRFDNPVAATINPFTPAPDNEIAFATVNVPEDCTSFKTSKLGLNPAAPQSNPAAPFTLTCRFPPTAERPPGRGPASNVPVKSAVKSTEPPFNTNRAPAPCNGFTAPENRNTPPSASVTPEYAASPETTNIPGPVFRNPAPPTESETLPDNVAVPMPTEIVRAAPAKSNAFVNRIPAVALTSFKTNAEGLNTAVPQTALPPPNDTVRSCITVNVGVPLAETGNESVTVPATPSTAVITVPGITPAPATSEPTDKPVALTPETTALPAVVVPVTLIANAEKPELPCGNDTSETPEPKGRRKSALIPTAPPASTNADVPPTAPIPPGKEAAFANISNPPSTRVGPV
jgi:hypothetical protein